METTTPAFSSPTTPTVAPKTPNPRMLLIGIALVLALVGFVVRFGLSTAPSQAPALVPESEGSEDVVTILEPDTTQPEEVASIEDSKLSIRDIRNNGLLYRSASGLTKWINGTQYAFVGSQNSPEYRKELAILDDQGNYQVSQDRFLQVLGSYISNRTSDFWIDRNSLTLYLVDALPESYDRSVTIFQLVFKQDDMTYTLASKKIIAFVPTSAAYEMTKIIDVQPAQHALLLNSAGGDGCGGSGTVWTLDTQTLTRTDILAHGVGCAPGPNYGGLYSDGRIIAADRKPLLAESEQLWDETTYTSLYLLNPFTLEKEVLTTDGSLFTNRHLIPNSTEDFASIPTADLTDRIIFAQSSMNHENPRDSLFVFDVATKQLRPL